MLARIFVLLLALGLFAAFSILPCYEVTAQECFVDTTGTLFGSDACNIYHEYGTGVGEFAPADSFFAFSQICSLLVTDHVVERWSADSLSYFIRQALDDDSTSSASIFPQIWSYFCDGDSNASYSQVRFKLPGDPMQYKKIVIKLYDRLDLPEGCADDYYFESHGYSGSSGNELILNAEAVNYPPADPYNENGFSPVPWTVNNVLTLGFAHELQHLAFAASGRAALGYESLNETLSTLAEFMVHRPGSIRERWYDLPYDAGLYRGEDCDADSKYSLEQLWILYLYEHFPGPTNDISDDLVYRWIREHGSFFSPEMADLATILSDSEFSWLGGANGGDRLRSLFSYYAVGRYCNAPDFASHDRFGFRSINPVARTGIFTDVNKSYTNPGSPQTPYECPPNPGGHIGYWNVRILPPSYSLAGANENTLATVSGTYTDADGSHDKVDVCSMGADYIVFRPGAYFQDDDFHELKVSVYGGYAGGAAGYSEIQPYVLGYSTDSPDLFGLADSLLFVEPLHVSKIVTVSHGDSARARVVVTDFGRSVKSVVLVIPNVLPNILLHGSPHQFFTYSYTYGVFTPGASARSWGGDVLVVGDVPVEASGTLTINPGTHVKIFNSDLANAGADTNRVEINVDGALDINGNAGDPVAIQPWTQVTSEDWAGIYLSSTSTGGSFDYCTLGYAENVIDSYAPITLNHATIHSASDALIKVTNSTLDINVSEVSVSNGDGIVLVGSDATIDSTEIVDCYGYGLHESGNGVINISHGNIHDNDVGVYVGSSATTTGTISETRFDGNTIGVSFYGASRPNIDECVITNNPSSGIRLDHYSSPNILHCMDSATYDGDITGNGVGVFCTDHSSPVVGHCDFHSNSDGVGAFDGSAPLLNGNGSNKFRSHSGYHVVNQTVGLTIDAENNYWSANTGAPDYYPRVGKTLGDIDYANALSSAPNPTSMWPGNPPQDTPKEIVTGLGRAHPNPFNPIIQVPFSLKSAAQVQITVYDVAGRLVRTLVHEHRNRGEYSVTWDGTSDSGSHVASAVYFVRMRAGSFVETQKIVLLK